MTNLDDAVLQHVRERGRLLDPERARDRCQVESAAFMETLAAHGIEATVVSGFKHRGNIIMAGHFAVRVGDDVWDWTARQFDPAASVPLVTPWETWRQVWSDASEGWLDPTPHDIIAEALADGGPVEDELDAATAVLDALARHGWRPERYETETVVRPKPYKPRRGRTSHPLRSSSSTTHVGGDDPEPLDLGDMDVFRMAQISQETQTDMDHGE